MTREETQERFWATVLRGPGCWLCTGSPGSHGYAQVTGYGGRSVLAHRFSFELAFGPPGSAWVLHKCGNKRCVRPDHLYAGDHLENMADLSAVGHPRRKLDAGAVDEIRGSPLSQRELARLFGVSQRAIFNIRKGITYRYV